VFRNVDAAVSIFLVASGFLLFRAISASDTHEQMRPLTVAIRRVLRVGPAMWVMLVAVMVIAAVDVTDKESKQVNQDSLVHASTYTYNWLIQERLTQTRMDLGHLWYVSVDMQAVVVIAVIAFFLRHRPTALLAGLSGLFLVLVVWRFHSHGVENIWIALNRTTVRMDPLVLGAVVAAAVPRLSAGHRIYQYGAHASLVLLVPILFWCAGDGDAYLTWAGTALELVLAAYLLCSTLAPPSRHRVMGNPLLTAVGRMSLVIYLFHFPVFHFVRRHTIDWDWGWKVVVALLATAVIAVLAQLIIERPMSRVLRHPLWEDVRERGAVAVVRPRVVRSVRDGSWSSS
jgi:peptidoglycan/LPS O-acetylase OafA/YrhL